MVKKMARKRNSNDDNNHKESTLHPLLLFRVTLDLAREKPLFVHHNHRHRRRWSNVILLTPVWYTKNIYTYTLTHIHTHTYTYVIFSDRGCGILS